MKKSNILFSAVFLPIANCLLPTVSSAQVIAGGGYHSLAICTDTVWDWGLNLSGQLGDNTLTQRNTPVQVLAGGAGGTYLTGINAIIGGTSHSIALRNDGTVWDWGQNTVGQLGDNTQTQRNTPVQVLAGAAGGTYLTGITAIAGGREHSLALRNDGTVWAWGRNDDGQLGDNTTIQKNTPVQVLAGDAGGTYLTGITAIAGGYWHSFALRNDGTVWAWGWNFYGPLGDNTTAQRNTPVQVLAGAAGGTYLTGITAIVGGYEHSHALRNDGTVWAWGRNDYGQLGDNTTTDRLTPVQVLAGGAGGTYLTGITAIEGGYQHSLALRNDGTVWDWGRNDNFGQLGDNTLINKYTPVQVLAGAAGGTYLTGITAIAGGGYHSLALRNDGTVWDWGRNDYGQLGDNTSGTLTWTPVQVTGLCSVGGLPIELLSFTATAENNSLVRCDWITATELNNDYFLVQRSRDAQTFETIGQVDGAGNSSTTLHYAFTDQDPYTGLSYYRLKQVDFNGDFTYSEIRAVYIGTISTISIYPNPASEYIEYLLGSAEGGAVTVKLYDALGREVYNKEETIEKGLSKERISTVNLSNGNYLIRITNGNKEKTQKQFVIK